VIRTKLYWEPSSRTEPKIPATSIFGFTWYPARPDVRSSTAAPGSPLASTSKAHIGELPSSGASGALTRPNRKRSTSPGGSATKTSRDSWPERAALAPPVSGSSRFPSLPYGPPAKTARRSSSESDRNFGGRITEMAAPRGTTLRGTISKSTKHVTLVAQLDG